MDNFSEWSSYLLFCKVDTIICGIFIKRSNWICHDHQVDPKVDTDIVCF
jgi:hypothetical protein